MAGLNWRSSLLALILLHVLVFQLITIDRPFYYDNEATGSFYGVLARNYHLFSWAETRGMPVVTVGRPPDGSLFFYPDHPPLVPLLISQVYAVFGVGEWQTRLPNSIAIVAATGMLYLLLVRSATPRIALLAAAIFAAMPVTIVFGGQPEVVGTLLVFFALVTVFAYMRFHAQPRMGTWLRLMAAFTLAAVSDWPAFVIVPVLIGHFLNTRPRDQWKWAIAFGAGASVVFASLYLYIALATHQPWDWMVQLFAGRSAIGVPQPFTTREWLATAFGFNRDLYTVPILVAAVAWIVVSGFRAYRNQVGVTIARLLAGWGVLHVLIGRQGVYVHHWWWWPLTPAVAVCAALLLDWLVRRADRRSRWSNHCAAVGIVIFAGWTAFTSWRAIYPVRGETFTTLDLGAAIRAAAPGANDVAMVVWRGVDPQLWFYGDRPLRTDVWSVEDFERRVRGDTVDLTFGASQSWPAAAAGLVFPRQWDRRFDAFRTYLQQRYPVTPLPPSLSARFTVFDLRRPLTDTR